MWPHADLLAHTHDRQREMIARADRFRLVKRARRNQAMARGRPDGAGGARVATGTARPAAAPC